jgi:hypothetical protein
MSAITVAQGIGYLTVREVDCLQAIARLLPSDPLCVNIGSGAGTSVLAVYEARPDARIVDIDINPLNGLDQLIVEGVTADWRYRRLTGDSKSIAFDQLYDYLFIDGDHTEPGIRGDLLAWLPRARAGAYILLHDYWPYPEDHELAGVDYWPNVKIVADELLGFDHVVTDIDRIRSYQIP